MAEHKKRGDGFTLAEAVVAVFVGLLVLATIHEIFKNFYSINTNTEESETVNANMIMAMELMSNDIGMASFGNNQSDRTNGSSL